MPNIPVTINEKSAPSLTLCANHGTTLNCPAVNCPGVSLTSAATAKESRDIDDAVFIEVLKRDVRDFVRHGWPEGPSHKYEFEVDGIKVRVQLAK